MVAPSAHPGEGFAKSSPCTGSGRCLIIGFFHQVLLLIPLCYLHCPWPPHDILTICKAAVLNRAVVVEGFCVRCRTCQV